MMIMVMIVHWVMMRTITILVVCKKGTVISLSLIYHTYLMHLFSIQWILIFMSFFGAAFAMQILLVKKPTPPDIYEKKKLT